MAKRSFLTDEDFGEAREILLPPLVPPDGQLHAEPHFNCQSFSQWLSLRLEARLRKSSYWADAQPIATGSWARAELAPLSDFDLIFCGDESAVKHLVDELHEMGLSVRYRMPENPADWTQGVEVFDWLALLHARPFTPYAAARLNEQTAQLNRRLPKLRGGILKEVAEERRQRAERHDSMTSFLEPNIKYGPGGLRDIFQGFRIYELFREKFSSEVSHAQEVFRYYRSFFLTIRQKMHLDGFGELLSAPEQLELSQWFQYESHHEFMRQVQRGLSRSSFYSDWILEQAQSSLERIRRVQGIQLTTKSSPLTYLQKDPSKLMQHKVRRSLNEIYHHHGKPEEGSLIGKLVMRAIHVDQKEEVTEAVFRSHLIHPWVPELNRLRGLVQHDQYHRYTAEAHIFRAVREVQRAKAHPARLGALKDIAKHLSPHDWKILSWTALYHDLGKGIPGVEHSEYGQHLFEADAVRLRLSQRLRREVPWMVRNHLILSHAAFRTDPHSPETWEHLQRMGVHGRRLPRLAIFTAIDIIATNSEAWNSWKSRLLLDLVRVMEAPETASYLRTREAIQRSGIEVREDFLRSLDSSVFLTLPTAALRKDLVQLVEDRHADLRPLVLKDRNGLVWVRFHRRKDQLGLFEGFVAELFAMGCKVRIAAIHTDYEYGAYDWFQVQTNRTTDQLKRVLDQIDGAKSSVEIPAVFFHEIELVSELNGQYVVSFKGPDQKGLLLNAARALRKVGAQVQWARVHTWGRQIDDVFGVDFTGSGSELISSLRTLVPIKSHH